MRELAKLSHKVAGHLVPVVETRGSKSNGLIHRDYIILTDNKNRVP
jgi:hypothetical protein